MTLLLKRGVAVTAKMVSGIDWADLGGHMQVGRGHQLYKNTDGVWCTRETTDQEFADSLNEYMKEKDGR